jgi:hypothetical protein
MPTEDEEFLAQVEAELNAQLEAELMKRRVEIAARLRREESRKHYEKINARHPTEDRWGGLGPDGHAARLRVMDERAAQANREMDAANARVVDGNLKAQRMAHKGGAAGFKIK